MIIIKQLILQAMVIATVIMVIATVIMVAAPLLILIRQLF